MNLNEAKTILANNGYLVETYTDDYEKLCGYLNDTLRAEKIGCAWYDGNSIRIMDINERGTICDIIFDEDDICVNYEGKGKWFTADQDPKAIKDFIEKRIYKLCPDLKKKKG